MDLSSVVARLQERLSDLRLREIAQAPGLDDAMRSNKAAPAVYVLPLSERGIALDHTGPVDQIEHRLFAVLMVLAIGSSKGLVDLATLRLRTKKALVGWVAEQDPGEPITFQGGELVHLPGNGTQWWSDEFLMIGYFRSEE